MRISRAGISPAEAAAREAGFTFLELAVVLAIMAGVVALVFPRIGGALETMKLKSAGRHLASTASGLRQEAVMTRQTYRIVFYLKEGTFQVDRLTGDGKPQVLRQDSLPSGVSFLDVETGKQGKVRDGEASCDFFPGGYAEETTIHLSGAGRRRQTLFIKPFSLGVEIQDGYVEQQTNPL